MSTGPAVPEAKANPRGTAAGPRQQPADGSGQLRNLPGVADRPGGVSPYSDDTITLVIRSLPGPPNAGSSAQGGDGSFQFPTMDDPRDQVASLNAMAVSLGDGIHLVGIQRPIQDPVDAHP